MPWRDENGVIRRTEIVCEERDFEVLKASVRRQQLSGDLMMYFQVYENLNKRLSRQRDRYGKALKQK